MTELTHEECLIRIAALERTVRIQREKLTQTELLARSNYEGWSDAQDQLSERDHTIAELQKDKYQLECVASIHVGKIIRLTRLLSEAKQSSAVANSLLNRTMEQQTAPASPAPRFCATVMSRRDVAGLS